MSDAEKLADELGQIIFRMETNFYTLKRFTMQSAPSEECQEDISADLEKLKGIKARILTVKPS